MADVVPSDQDDIDKSLSQWRQGDFSLGVGPFLYGGLTDKESSEEQIDPYFDDNCLGFVAISQTCEIVNDKVKNPFVALCALVKIAPQHLKMVEKGQAPGFALIGNAPDGLVADLNRIMTVKKELLATFHRNDGFDNENDARTLARALERKHGRFAFPDAFNRSIKPLRDKILEKYSRENSPLGKAIRAIDQIRIRPSKSWNATSNIKITFLFFFKEIRSVDIPLEDISSELESLIESITWEAPFEPDDNVPIKIGSYADLTAKDYFESVPLDINALSFAARFKAN